MKKIESIRTGIILNVENYHACVDFYESVFGLSILFSEKDGDFMLTCFEFGASYLMIETEGVAYAEGKSVKECPSKLRFHVDDIESAIATIETLDLKAEVIRAQWGTTINIHDPDGNRIGIRDEGPFLKQLKR